MEKFENGITFLFAFLLRHQKKLQRQKVLHLEDYFLTRIGIST